MLCSGGALHDEFPRPDSRIRPVPVAIGNLALADLPPYSLLSPDRCPLFHQPEQFADLKELFCLMDRYAAEREPGFQELCQHLMLASLELVRRMAAGRKEDLVTRRTPPSAVWPDTSTAIMRRTSPSSSWPAVLSESLSSGPISSGRRQGI